METTNLENTVTSQQHGNASNTSNKDYLIENWIIENTPFNVIKQEDNHFVAVANKRVSGFYKTKEEAEEDGKTIDWIKIMAVMLSMIESEKIKNIDVK